MAPPTPSDNWQRGDSYERFMGRWSRRLAPRFLAWLGAPAGRRWLDVGSGTGALCSTVLEHCAPSSVIGVEPSEGFLAKAKQQVAGVTFHQGSATAIPLRDRAVDVTVSGLVLNFVPDARAALAEMMRVTDTSGTIGIYVWDYSGGMQIIRYFWDAAAEVNPGQGLDESQRFPLCRQAALTELFGVAGLGDVEVSTVEIPTPFSSFDDYWLPFLGGQGPAPAYAMSLDEATRARLRDRLRARLPIRADGSIELTARAWAARGTVAK